MKAEDKTAREKPDTKFLRDIALVLEGYKLANGSLAPILGEYHLKTLWAAITFINNSLPI